MQISQLGSTVSSFKVGAAEVTDTIDLESCPGKKKNPLFVLLIPEISVIYIIFFLASSVHTFNTEVDDAYISTAADALDGCHVS